MRQTVSAILVGVLVVGAYILVTRLPWVMVYRNCYELAYSIIDEEGIITRRAWTSDEVICAEHKQKLLTSVQCEKDTEAKEPMGQTVKKWVLEGARFMAKGTKTMEEMIADHNKRCSYPKTTLYFDTKKQVWF